MYEDTSKFLTQNNEAESEFGKYVEKALIPLALDHPDLFLSIGRFLTPDLFEAVEARYVIAIILNHIEKHQIVPTRGLLRDFILQHMTEDDPYESVLELIDQKSNPRDVPILKEKMVEWARKRAFGLIYSDEAMLAYQNGDFDEIEKIVEEANRITDLQVQGLWLLDNYELLFSPSAIEHRTSGFRSLDKFLNDGGPGPKEVVCWLAGTNVGKCHSLSTSIVNKENSQLYELEMEDGTVRQLAGFRKVQTARGAVKVKDLTEEDEIGDLPSVDDSWDLELSDMRLEV
jgi:hypothetical protein